MGIFFIGDTIWIYWNTNSLLITKQITDHSIKTKKTDTWTLELLGITLSYVVFLLNEKIRHAPNCDI